MLLQRSSWDGSSTEAVLRRFTFLLLRLGSPVRASLAGHTPLDKAGHTFTLKELMESAKTK